MMLILLMKGCLDMESVSGNWSACRDSSSCLLGYPVCIEHIH